MKRYWCVLVLFCSMVSCIKSVDTVAKKTPSSTGFREYIIPKGEHYAAGNSLATVNKKSIAFRVRFDSSCIYKTILAENAGDINKLYGFSDCASRHQVNSARFGWVWNGKAIELHAYCYSESVRSIKLLGSVAIGQEIDLELGVEQGKYVFTTGEKKELMPRSCTADRADGYQLYPYFGGDETAPHDMRIYIMDL